jgi:SH3 domain-containing YSC84-like protein 1
MNAAVQLVQFLETHAMKPLTILTGMVAFLTSLGCPTSLWGQASPPVVVDCLTKETEIVNASSRVLREIMEIPVRGIPETLLTDARGLVIIPGMLKGGFIVGVRRGHGVVLVRDAQGHWQPPVFATVTGGSLGWQIGIQSTDLVLVFRTSKSIDKLLHGNFTIGADAAAAAGPVGREATAATDYRLDAEVYSYSRSRGLFAGISLDGSAIEINKASNATFYGAPGPGQTQELPSSAKALLTIVAQYTTPASATPSTVASPKPDTSTEPVAPAPVPVPETGLRNSSDRY